MNVTDNYSNLQIDEGYTLFKMLGDLNEIEVPIIQRDYAQGRKNAKEIRDDFLNDLFAHMINKEQIKLSFVYGATRHTSNRNIYIPYDGQQRLTLLYLLTLYLAAYSQSCDDIKKLSRFKYYTRDSATDFCAFLTRFNESDDAGKNNVFKRIDLYASKNIREQIEDDIEFFGTWIYDPTVESMLVVLETIHEYFINRFSTMDMEEKKDKAKELLNTLNGGYVFFDWCSINASDGIYIKMNGRGKPLSAFDNFKNTLYAELNKLRDVDRKNNVIERIQFLNDFEVKMDGVWTDLFWSYRNHIAGDTCYDIAPFMMNFLFYAFELRYTIKTKTFFFGGRMPFSWIDEKNAVSFLNKYKESCKVDTSDASIVDLDDYVWVSKLLDILYFRFTNDRIDKSISEIEGYKEEFDIWREASAIRVKTETRNVLSPRASIISAFYYEYLVNSSSFDDDGKLIACDDCCRMQWLSLIGKLMKTVGHYKGRSDALQRDKHIFTGLNQKLMKTVFSYSAKGDLIDVSDHFDSNFLRGIKDYFDASHAFNQLYEEVLKYQLIKSDSAKWTNRISNAEKELPYFDKQIYFLFALSSDASGIVDERKFDGYLNTIKSITDASGIKESVQGKFTAIMLSFKDYRITSGEGYSNALGLCSNKSNENFKWRNFFDVLDGNTNSKVEVLRQVLDCISAKGDIDAAYADVLSNNTPDRWRNVIIKYPEVLAHGSNHRIVYEDDTSWYLIKSNLAKQVHKNSLQDSVNLELYGIYREAGFNDRSDIAQGKKLVLDNAEQIEKISNNKFCHKDAQGNVIVECDYDGMIAHLKSMSTHTP